MHTRLAKQREPWVDGLRALAVLGVFVVNAMGYPFSPNYPLYLGMPLPADSTLALVVHGFLVALIQGKAWPLLCFLFGYSLASIALRLRAENRFSKPALRVRYWKLLLLGVLHGTLFYFGDILTMYALCGLIASRWVLIRPRKLIRVFKILSIALALLVLLMLASGVSLALLPQAQSDAIAMDAGLFRFFSAADMFAFWSLNARAYVSHQSYGLIFMPLFLWLTVAGVLVRRFRLFSAQRRARVFWANHLGVWQLCVALLLNGVLGYLSTQYHGMTVAQYNSLSAVVAFSLLPGVWLTAALVAWGMRHWHTTGCVPRWIVWLAPAGQLTLAMYLSLSIALALSNQAFLGISGNTLASLLVVLSMWMAAVVLARMASQRGLRDPITRWLSPALQAPRS